MRKRVFNHQDYKQIDLHFANSEPIFQTLDVVGCVIKPHLQVSEKFNQAILVDTLGAGHSSIY